MRIAFLLLTASFFSQNLAAQAFDPRDLSGVFTIRHPSGYEGMGEPVPPRTPEGQERFSQTVTARTSQERPVGVMPAFGNDPIMKCDPMGFPRVLFYGGPTEFIQLPGRIIQFFERSHKWRTIWLDGRTRPVDSNSPSDPEPRYHGYSVGRWEGDTLIVNTSGFDDRPWLDRYGNVYSDEMRFEERYRKTDRDTIQLVMTLTDPRIYTRPWVSETKTLRRTTNWEIGEDLCIPSEEEFFNKVIRDPAAGVER
jgi:hypothetical protein